MELKECPDCTHKISVTAISCPVCGWVVPLEQDTSSNSSGAQKAGKVGAWLAGAAVIAALGPAAVAGAIGSLLVPSGVNMKGVRKKAKVLGAIDIFRISDDEMALVTEKSIWTVDGRGANREIPLKELTNVEIVGGFYYAPNDYINTGDNSLDIVKYAYEKIKEYAFNCSTINGK
jgi:hypothetical protein